MSLSPVTNASSYTSFSRPLQPTTNAITGVVTGSGSAGFSATAATSSSGTSAGGALAGTTSTTLLHQPPTNLFDDRYFAPSAYLYSFPTSGLDPTQPIYTPSNQALYAYYNPQPLQVTESATASVSTPQVQSQTGSGGTAAAVYQDGTYGKTTTIYNPNTNATTTIDQAANFAESLAGTSPHAGTMGLGETVGAMQDVMTTLNGFAGSFTGGGGPSPASTSAGASSVLGTSNGSAGGTAWAAADGSLMVDGRSELLSGSVPVASSGAQGTGTGSGQVSASVTGALLSQPPFAPLAPFPPPPAGPNPPSPFPLPPTPLPELAISGPTLPPILYPQPDYPIPIINGVAIVPTSYGNPGTPGGAPPIPAPPGPGDNPGPLPPPPEEPPPEEPPPEEPPPWRHHHHLHRWMKHGNGGRGGPWAWLGRSNPFPFVLR